MAKTNIFKTRKHDAISRSFCIFVYYSTLKMKPGKRLTHIDCFAGPGGICTGLHAAGFDTKVAIEWIHSCCETYATNHPGVKVIESDIRDVKAADILPFIPEDGIDLVTSGMPCETFSTAGNKSRSFYDDRQFLFREGIRIATIARAKMILFENVPAITSKTISREDCTLIVDLLKKELAEAGYSNLIEVVLDATKFGVPQKRNRYFILATRYPEWELSAPTPTCKEPTTVADALCDLPNVEPNSRKDAREYTSATSSYSRLMKDSDFWDRGNFATGLTLQTAMRHRPSTIKRFSLLREGEGLKELFARYTGEERELLQKERVLPKKMFIKRNVRLKLKDPSSTVTSHCLDEFVHPIYDRALTVRECARLQSFPDSYYFAGPCLVPHID
ncbi:MAG: DNA cytosine methyltransferase, partial [Muribaculaceae bacterium]|nr:DNA cytosine methyltransferase [Muribaculaceae bacterium]